jgi:hypothetical protein
MGVEVWLTVCTVSVVRRMSTPKAPSMASPTIHQMDTRNEMPASFSAVAPTRRQVASCRPTTA